MPLTTAPKQDEDELPALTEVEWLKRDLGAARRLLAREKGLRQAAETTKEMIRIGEGRLGAAVVSVVLGARRTERKLGRVRERAAMLEAVVLHYEAMLAKVADLQHDGLLGADVAALKTEVRRYLRPAAERGKPVRSKRHTLEAMYDCAKESKTDIIDVTSFEVTRDDLGKKSGA
jgi:hypothetical protein